MIALTACGYPRNRSDRDLTNAVSTDATSPRPSEGRVRTSTAAGKNLPAKYMKALSCDFDENPVVAVQTYHRTAAGRTERAHDVTLLKSLGFTREGRDDDLESVGARSGHPPA